MLAAPLWLCRAGGGKELAEHVWISDYKPVPLPFVLVEFLSHSEDDTTSRLREK